MESHGGILTRIPRKRTFGWMMRWRRLVRDHERRCDVSEAMIRVAMGARGPRYMPGALDRRQRGRKLGARAGPTAARVARAGGADHHGGAPGERHGPGRGRRGGGAAGSTATT
jgi:hypothetical protein